MSTLRFPPAPRAALAAGAAGAVVAAAAGALVGAAAAGALVGAAPAGLAVAGGVGADRFGAEDEHALMSEVSTPPVKPSEMRERTLRRVSLTGSVLIG